MLFNSIDFALFLPIVFILYWFVFNRNLRVQNALLLVASYTFYGWWDYRFLALILISSVVDYLAGMQIASTGCPGKRKAWLLLSLFTNLGLLGFFKYANFFIDSFVRMLTILGLSVNQSSLQVILPVGISFYTFQTLSYTIDIYRGKIKPTRDVVAFFTFVAFFPQLVAGPIERAKSLLPQFLNRRRFDAAGATDGMRQILWGLFKKVAVADTCARLVNEIFANYQQYESGDLILGVIYFAFQIYGDFSGYSDIAIGTARLFGFGLMRNFAFPYFSRDIAEFWRRWHISLSTWFRDYVYIPLGGSRVKPLHHIRNTLITFTVSGFWHGANWNFIFWGFLNGLYYLPLMLSNRVKTHMDMAATGKRLPGFREWLSMVLTFILTCIAWIFFRADNIRQGFYYLLRIASTSPFSVTRFSRISFLFIFILVITEWIQRQKEHGLQFDRVPVAWRWAVYYGLILLIYFSGNFQSKYEFIYFQF